MSRNYFVGVIACVLLVVAYSRLPAQEGAKPAPSAGGWEYHVVLLTDLVSADQTPAEQTTALETKFNDLGQEGWELCQQLNRVVVFKRETR